MSAESTLNGCQPPAPPDPVLVASLDEQQVDLADGT
jgi:hypothetical protein